MTNEISALINLLDDPDKEVYQHVTDKLISLGTTVIPSLEEAWEKSFDPNLHYRLEELIHIIQYENLLFDLKKWATDDKNDLLEGATMIARYQYPDLDVFKMHQQLDRIGYDISQEMNYNQIALEQVNVFNHVLFTLNGFSGNTANIQDPQSNYLNYVLESKKGNPVSLSVLYLILAAKVHMPVYGIHLPQHFVLSFHKDFILKNDEEQKIKSQILFYINPFNKGVIFSRNDISVYLKKLNADPKPEYFLPCSNKHVIVTLINSLISSYELAGISEKVRELLRVKEIIE
ncbi:MAG: transglutaminase-like domain-containing protein [Chitinophagales bacterium]|nr:transglutaminase-like domain-containing protein [Chitinophagales bacterium]